MMKEEIKYNINKGVNRPLEFRGLRAQYIIYLALGLAALLITFVILYITGVPVYLCMPVVLIAGSGLFIGVYRLSHRFGEHGLMKALAFRQVPTVIFCHSRKVFKRLTEVNENVIEDDHNTDTRRPAARSGIATK